MENTEQKASIDMGLWTHRKGRGEEELVGTESWSGSSDSWPLSRCAESGTPQATLKSCSFFLARAHIYQDIRLDAELDLASPAPAKHHRFHAC